MSTGSFVSRLTAIAVFAFATTTNQAAIFATETVAGTLDGTTTFGGVALGSATAFSFDAIFLADPSFNEAAAAPGVGLYPVFSLSITIAGKGTYDATMDTPLFTLLADPSNGTYPVYFAGLAGSDNGSFFSAFASTTPPLDAHAPGSVVYDGYLATLYGDPLTISLTGVTGGLVLSDGCLVGPVTATLTVPEPETWAITAAGSLLVFASGRCWKTRQSLKDMW